jgi:hypothetical protein
LGAVGKIEVRGQNVRDQKTDGLRLAMNEKGVFVGRDERMTDVVQEVLNDLSREDMKEYPRNTIEKALVNEKDLTPHLLEILENLLNDPESFRKRERFFAHNFAMNLLAHFGNEDAHETILKTMVLPREILGDLFGDMITEDFPRILYQTCAGRYEGIKDLVLNRKADEFVRGSAMKALVFGVLLDDLTRSETLEFFRGLFTGTEAEDSNHFWNAAASCVCQLYPEELMDTIREAYERGLIWPGYIGMKSFERALSEDQSSFLANKKQALTSEIRSEFHGYMSWWACFRERMSPAPGRGLEDALYRQSRDEGVKKGKKRSKNKSASASRRKNRRR